MAVVTLDKISKFYQSESPENQRLQVLKDVTLDVQHGEFVAFFGPNGCGKTTLLNVIAGLIPVDSGYVRIDDQEPGQACFGYIFQDYRQTLLPWKRACDNIAYPLYLQGMPRKQRRESVRRMLADLSISIPLDLWPSQLSGGQQQLLAVARALITQPDIMLFDEPFSALDIESRLQMRDTLQDIWRRTCSTIIFVSHEIDEAILLADRLVMLSRKPSQILDVIDIPFPHPRPQSLLEEEEFFAVRRRALRVFREAMRV
jgi:NitT/TauT family transport system ATP-binding protein